MSKFLIAIPSFPGSNGEVDNVRTLKRCGFDTLVFRWNDSLEKLRDVDGYFFGAGFSYEDRGRSGMVAARDPLFRFIHEEAARGKVVIGNCNGAQVLIESGLIPLGDGLRMCLAHNAIRRSGHDVSPGFLSEWVWIKRACAKDRCATSDWEGTLHIPIAHGEGRFVTRDPDLISKLKQDDQIAFQYCDAAGTVSDQPPITPNGSTLAIAGICNAEGNVVCMMPHPERTERGDPYFHSMRRWMERRGKATANPSMHRKAAPSATFATPPRGPMPYEIFIDTIITNNEERTVEHAARRIAPSLSLKQYRFVGLESDRVAELLSSLTFFNPNKEIAYVRTSGTVRKWNAERKKTVDVTTPILTGISLLRRDIPDTKGDSIGGGALTGICYDCRNIDPAELARGELLEVFGNPHASTLEILDR